MVRSEFRFTAFLQILAYLLHLTKPTTGAPQQVYAPFSGIVYLVSPNGQTVNTASLTCPASAPNACSNLNSPNWCCPSGYTCAIPAAAPNLLGCCPVGQSCQGTPSVTTVTVAVAPVVQQSTVYVAATPTVLIQATTVVVQPTKNIVIAAGGYCSTLTMKGPDLPTTAAGSCGTILIVNAAETLRAWSTLAAIVGSVWIGGYLLAARLI